MGKAKGTVSLRVTDTPSGRICSVIYRGPHGKQTLKNLGFCDPTTPEGKEMCLAALSKYLPTRKATEGM